MQAYVYKFTTALTGKVMRSVVSVRPSCPSYILNKLIFDIEFLHYVFHDDHSSLRIQSLQDHRSRSSNRVKARVRKDGNAVGLTSIHDRAQFVSGNEEYKLRQNG